ncbi:DNA-3-methyladenine glycosylase family protein [Dongia deserti]|uniref:DNA-3-methyladenine glycosylase family protein n=1 Tax=Dongia deserti TaxID=2268030 RepID=UPI000E657B1F|nr:DNA-3-methyladenine glycosylase [Dongia deserti]
MARPKEDRDLLQRALAHLGKADQDFARAIEEVGPPPARRRPAGFLGLLHVIVAQQVSTHAAKAISARLDSALEGNSPEAFLKLSDDDLRAIGFSRQKIIYGRDLAAAFLDGRLSMPRLRRQSDEEVIAAITSVKGLGVWSAEVFLLFGLRRPDVLPAHDLGLVVAAQRMKRLKERPSPMELREIAEPWRPYRSYASRMLWHYYHAAPPV